MAARGHKNVHASPSPNWGPHVILRDSIFRRGHRSWSFWVALTAPRWGGVEVGGLSILLFSFRFSSSCSHAKPLEDLKGVPEKTLACNVAVAALGWPVRLPFWFRNNRSRVFFVLPVWGTTSKAHVPHFPSPRLRAGWRATPPPYISRRYRYFS